jgi:hypothetical protein
MPACRRGIPAAAVNPRGARGHRTRDDHGRQATTMRLFYLILTMLLVVSLGLLGAVTP